ncbi:unnamed protein product [Darwinula stevensoni]|uniref:AIG1-type G domain-containing protein n=1 Tax=Darwinula stevensoni TaxID=69355 RepID=A0A7R9A8C4_9CRUS|nr:unnamed protein product [Darwinula stevensoni]CAG0896277.1 unnamed protein product [Darwinula stevensoni]
MKGTFRSGEMDCQGALRHLREILKNGNMVDMAQFFDELVKKKLIPIATEVELNNLNKYSEKVDKVFFILSEKNPELTYHIVMEILEEMQRDDITEEILKYIGKTTMINGLANYIYGVQWEDGFRFKVITEEADLDQSRKAHSQTHRVSAYSFNWQEGILIPYTLTVIDTPGFGDSQGIEKDDDLVIKIREFFEECAPYGLNFINAVGFVLPSSASRITATQRYISHAITQLFGIDTKDNFVLLVSHCDGQEPPAINTVKETNIVYQSYHTFNNAALFACIMDPMQKMFWEQGLSSCGGFLASLHGMASISLKWTRKVLHERGFLMESLKKLQAEIPAVVSAISVLQEKCILLRKNEGEVTKLVEFEDEKMKIHLDKKRNEKAINCTYCTVTCEYPPSTSKLKDIKNSRCMNNDEEVKCTKCKCSWKAHQLELKRYEVKHMYRSKSSKNSAIVAQQIKVQKDQERKVRELTMDIFSKQVQLFAQIQEAHMRKTQLQKIALNPDPLTLEEYIEFLIQAEKREGKKGNLSRIEHLENAKKASLLFREEKYEEILPNVMSILKEEEINFEKLGSEVFEDIHRPKPHVHRVLYFVVVVYVIFPKLIIERDVDMKI